MQDETIKIIECPRDAMQGWPHLVSTGQKLEYLQALLEVGFDTIDFGSFVSPRLIPQMADTAKVIEQLDAGNRHTKLLAIVANTRGAEEALVHDQVDCLGFPFSVSPTFQQRNTNSTIEESLQRVEDIQELCVKNNRSLVVYISMAFGNPYGDPYSPEIVFEWIEKIAALDIHTISLADTVGVATAEQVGIVTTQVLQQFSLQEIGVHLHSTQENWQEKLEAALAAGCRRFDGAMKGIGGCPMAGNELVGNMNTEQMIGYFNSRGLQTHIEAGALALASKLATKIFS